MPRNSLRNRRTAPPPQKRARGHHTQAPEDGAGGKASHGAGKGRAYSGKLAGLMDMPLDIFFEVSTHLHPLGLLHLSRVSKQLRSVMLSPKSKFAWVASLANVEGLPPCPKDMSEPAYSALLFGRVCNLCSASRSCWVDYAIRIRLCKVCYKINVLSGLDIFQRHINPVMHKLLMAMTPCETGHDITIAAMLEQPFSHKLQNKYYLPQLQEMHTLAQEHKNQMDGKPVTEDDLTFLTSSSVKLHKHATALLKWESDVALRKQGDENTLTANRKASIIEKLNSIGYAEDDFPRTNVKDWTKIMHQPKGLTDRIWKNIKPKLEALLLEEKESRIREALEARAEERLDQISGYYDDFVEGLPEANRTLLPNLYDARYLPCIQALSLEHDGQGVVAREEFLALTAQILQEVEAYKTKAKATAATAMAECFSRWGPQTRVEELHHLNPDQAMTRHYAVFECAMKGHPPDVEARYLSFEAMHNHWRVYHPTVKWGFRIAEGSGAWGYIRCSGEPSIGKEGNLILDAAGLPHDTPMSVLTELLQSGRLYCLCEDPALPSPEQLDWPMFLAHVVEDLTRIQMRSFVRKTSKTPNPVPQPVLQSLHESLYKPGSATFITLLPEGADTSRAYARASVDAKTRKKIMERLALCPAGAGWIPACGVCKAMTTTHYLRGASGNALELPSTPEGIVHHLRGWHEKQFAERDIQFHNAGGL
ncbi:uncharacterized protein TRAVEDRAFT_53148 [Trametes versicolor FP-101664 SS1]|uniref:uncharacterized protein n=1 Tax=Trametes versicolor (strain FP-101664) TaxID=717944 RepID=UPI0004623B72|nr:uncharacterized protein TRAVEDRAFT_53148 [Trametes versicolor FP-101664 SS1]EIW52708.1 hypothetical protein TRAVEDRAFT_53148 [Trametes versicolor FP-101664 SS1]